MKRLTHREMINLLDVIAAEAMEQQARAVSLQAQADALEHDALARLSLIDELRPQIEGAAIAVEHIVRRESGSAHRFDTTAFVEALHERGAA